MQSVVTHWVVIVPAKIEQQQSKIHTNIILPKLKNYFIKKIVLVYQKIVLQKLLNTQRKMYKVNFLVNNKYKKY